MTSLRAVSTLCLFFLLFTAGRAEAASYMECIEKSRGRTIIWDSSWDSDKRDNGTRYKITDVSIYNRLPDRSVTLNMVATGNHSKRRRSYKVITEEKARAFCEHLVKEVRDLRFPGDTGIATEEASPSEASALGLPYIRFTSEGWVRDDPPSGEKLTTCRVLDTRFSCLPAEKEKFSRPLKELEEELRWRIKR